MDKPEDSQIYLDASYYKVARGKAWRWDGGEWVTSTRSVVEIEAEIYKDNTRKQKAKLN